jgi:TonB family protein
MRLPHASLAPLALVLLGPVLLPAQEEPLPAGTEGIPVPKRKKHVQPVYPKDALARGIRGIVILDVVIDREGKVTDVNIIRSIPGLDAAAVIAARQWEYEVTKVDGQPVSVRLTVPITFALRLPEMSRQEGIPELRQGVTPPWPESQPGSGRAVVDVTLDPDGRIGVARILEGEEPWAGSLLRALRTWRFSTPPEDAIVSFRVEADFVAGGAKKEQVHLRLTGLRQSQAFGPPTEDPAEVAGFEPSPVEQESPGGETTGTASPSEPTGSPVSEPEGPAEEDPPAVARAEPATPATEPTAPAATGPEAAAGAAPETPPAPTPPEAEPAAPPAPPSGPATTGPAEPGIQGGASPSPGPTGTAAPPGPGPAPASGEAPPQPTTPVAAGASAAGALAPGADPTAPPPVEVITASPPPLPPESGISAIRDVTLEPGVPDLAQGRRPVPPPLARMAGASGTLEVNFSVGAAGLTTVQNVTGPEVFKPAAQQAVESWVFRRDRANRVYLIAVFSYEGDTASAVVRPQPPP